MDISQEQMEAAASAAVAAIAESRNQSIFSALAGQEVFLEEASVDLDNESEWSLDIQ